MEMLEAFEHLPELLLVVMHSPAVNLMIARGDMAVERGYQRLAEFFYAVGTATGRTLVPSAGVKVGAFAIAGSNGNAFPDVAWRNVIALFLSRNCIDRQRAEFPEELLE